MCRHGLSCAGRRVEGLVKLLELQAGWSVLRVFGGGRWPCVQPVMAMRAAPVIWCQTVKRLVILVR